MLRQGLIFLLATILVVVFSKYFHLFIIYIDYGYNWLNLKMSSWFSHQYAGIMLRNIIALMVFPVAIAGIPAMIYKFIRGHSMPHYIELAWLVWLIVVLSSLLIR